LNPPLQAGLGRSEAAVLAATVSEIKKQTELKARLKRKVMSENPDITSEWFETFYAQNIPTAPVVNNNSNNAGNTYNGNNSPQTTSHHRPAAAATPRAALLPRARASVSRRRTRL
jgi:hypothetical protein